MSEWSINILSKTIKTNRLPDIKGFLEDMKQMGAEVYSTGHTIVINVGGLKHGPGREKKAGKRSR